jgi:hypothetical protein
MLGRLARTRQFLKDTVIAARNAIYKAGAPIKGAAVERLLKEFSLVPTLVSYFHFKLRIYFTSLTEYLR